MSSRSKTRPPWQGVGTGVKDAQALNTRPAWQSVVAGRSTSASSRSCSPVKPRVKSKAPSASHTRDKDEYQRSNTLHAYGSDTVSSSTGTTNTSVLTGSSQQSLDDPPPKAEKKHSTRTGRVRSSAAPKTPVQRTSAARKPAARTTVLRTTAARTPPERAASPAKSSSRHPTRSNTSSRTPKRRGASRQTRGQSSVRTKDKDGWEADSEDSFTVVGVEPKPCVWSVEKDTDEVRLDQLQWGSTVDITACIYSLHAPSQRLVTHPANINPALTQPELPHPRPGFLPSCSITPPPTAHHCNIIPRRSRRRCAVWATSTSL